jgi:predicted ArsR family transcriptional regulator
MNRKTFLEHCACSLCSCAAIGALVPASSVAAEGKPPEDWRLPFVRKRYAKLIEILAGKLDDATLNEILRQLGYDCAAHDPDLRKHKGDIDGFIREYQKQSNDNITYDREKGIITAVGQERSECACPLIALNLTSVKACNCTLGYTQRIYETVLGKKVQVELMESVLRGGKRCAVKVRVLE